MRLNAYATLRFVLATLLLIASFLKGHQLATEPMIETTFFESRLWLIAVVEGQLLLGIWLAANVRPQTLRPVTLGVFCTFACISAYKGLSGAESCGCFGRVSVDPWWTFVLDVAAIVALCLIRPRVTERQPSHPWMPVTFPQVMLLFLLIGIPGGLAMAMYRPAAIRADGMIEGDSSFVILEPEKWVGNKFPLIPYIRGGERLATGRWLIVFYHHGCPKCQEVMPKYEVLGRDLEHEQIAFVELPPYGNLPLAYPWCATFRISDIREWFLPTPFELELEDGVVRAASQELDRLHELVSGESDAFTH